jgi:glycerol-3-phosphate acyltransferase PlsY
VNLEPFVGPALGLALGYLLGSIPFGILLTKLGGAGDLRAIGSGNIGATNVLRTGRKGLAALTLILDMAKAVAAVLICDALLPGVVALPALGALIGHIFPVWLRFKGGKGVATFFGAVLGYTLAGELSWIAPAGYAAAWVGLLLLTRYSSVAGMSAALTAPVLAAALGRFDVALLFLGMGLLVFWMHRANLDRLLAGTEPRVGGSRDG